MVSSDFFSSPSSSLLRRIGRETTPALVPSSDVDTLRTTRTESGFLNVYASRHVWIAKVKEGGRLMAIPHSRQATPQQSAAYVVAWYKSRFGESWRIAVANRKRPYWQVKRSEQYGGWYLRIWANGQATEVRAPGASGRATDRPYIFKLRSSAVLYAMRDLHRQRRNWAAWAPPRAQ